MSNHARENLLRLMAARGVSLTHVAERTGLNIRTVRGVLRGARRPHAKTLHRLAEGLGVSVDEFFVDPTQLLYRRFDGPASPVVAEVIEDHKELFAGWTEADFDRLHRGVGQGEKSTAESTLAAVHQMNHRRQLHEKLDRLLESSHAQLTAKLLDALHENATSDTDVV